MESPENETNVIRQPKGVRAGDDEIPTDEWPNRVKCEAGIVEVLDQVAHYHNVERTIDMTAQLAHVTCNEAKTRIALLQAGNDIRRVIDTNNLVPNLCQFVMKRLWKRCGPLVVRASNRADESEI